MFHLKLQQKNVKIKEGYGKGEKKRILNITAWVAWGDRCIDADKENNRTQMEKKKKKVK